MTVNTIDTIDITALGNAMTDITLHITEEDIKYFGLKKGVLNGRAQYESGILDKIVDTPKKLYVGGSPSNVAFNAANLGLKTVLYGTVGDDDIGRNYIKCVLAAGITSKISILHGLSARSYILITPDGERTMIANMGVARVYDADFSSMAHTKIFHTSGYELITNIPKTLEAIDYAYRKGAKISFDLADKHIAYRERKNIDYILKKTSVLFATVDESEGLTGIQGDKGLDELRKICPTVIFKKGKDGSIVADKVQKQFIPIYPVTVINTCGAGDAYAAGFLYAYVKNNSLLECGHLGSKIASRVVSRHESNLLDNGQENC